MLWAPSVCAPGSSSGSVTPCPPGSTTRPTLPTSVITASQDDVPHRVSLSDSGTCGLSSLPAFQWHSCLQEYLHRHKSVLGYKGYIAKEQQQQSKSQHKNPSFEEDREGALRILVSSFLESFSKSQFPGLETKHRKRGGKKGRKSSSKGRRKNRGKDRTERQRRRSNLEDKRRKKRN